MASEQTHDNPPDDTEDIGDLLDSSGDDGGTELGGSEVAEGSGVTVDASYLSFELVTEIVHRMWKHGVVAEPVKIYYPASQRDSVEWMEAHRWKELREELKVHFSFEQYLPENFATAMGGGWLFIIKFTEE